VELELETAQLCKNTRMGQVFFFFASLKKRSPPLLILYCTYKEQVLLSIDTSPGVTWT
jgi:hypothetical protein